MQARQFSDVTFSELLGVWIKKFRVANYKSFLDSGMHELRRSINVIVGQNHSGKTALLNALGQKMMGNPHRSSHLRRTQAVNPISILDIDFIVSGQEARDIALSNRMNLQVPVSGDVVRSHGGRVQDVVGWIFSQTEITLSARLQISDGQRSWSQRHYPSNNLFQIGLQHQNFVQFTANQTLTDFNPVVMNVGLNDNIASLFGPTLIERTYYFDAQRLPQNDYQFGPADRLASDATNLAQMLNILQANRSEFAEYIDQVRRVIPLIKWVSVVPSKQRGQNVEVRIWNIEETSGRDDLTVPLAECGTGIGQVLSILYVVMKSAGNIIVIDEPNSFLHPRASKTLVNILGGDNNNQYIISTHSPEVIAASDPDRLFMLEFLDEETKIHEIARGDLESARQVHDEIGSRFSDIFGADQVLWVEGPTEVQCFPILLKCKDRQIGGALVIAPLRNTGDLESRHGEAIADIYRNLSSAHSLLPIPVGVSLDGDKRSSSNIKILERAFGHVIRFLPRRCYENYLIHALAISILLNATGAQTSDDAIRTWIEAHGKDAKYSAMAHNPFSPEWLREVDGPRLLDDLFQALTDSREVYRKTLHSLELTKWLIENDRASIQELIDYVASIVPENK